MRHAFLIIAHNEFEILQKLISQLDSEESDIFVHIDKKVKVLPQLSAFKSALYILPDRIDVRWGDVSQIKTELYLMEYAFHVAETTGDNYDYYHIISGVHLLLKSLSDFDLYFKDKPFAVFSEFPTTEGEIDHKIRRFNFFTSAFISNTYFLSRISQISWRLTNEFQHYIGIRHLVDEKFFKASQWCSLSDTAVSYLLSEKSTVLKKYRWTFCGDEFFAPSELMHSPLSQFIAWKSDYLYAEFNKKSSPKVLSTDEYEIVVASGCLWARKFSHNDMEIVEKIAFHSKI